MTVNPEDLSVDLVLPNQPEPIWKRSVWRNWIVYNLTEEENFISDSMNERFLGQNKRTLTGFFVYCSQFLKHQWKQDGMGCEPYTAVSSKKKESRVIVLFYSFYRINYFSVNICIFGHMKSAIVIVCQ